MIADITSTEFNVSGFPHAVLSRVLRVNMADQSLENPRAKPFYRSSHKRFSLVENLEVLASINGDVTSYPEVTSTSIPIFLRNGLFVQLMIDIRVGRVHLGCASKRLVRERRD